MDRFNIVATAIFALAVLHTFLAPRLTMAAHARAARRRAAGVHRTSIGDEAMELLGEVEVVFALWAVPLLLAIVWWRSWPEAVEYVNETVNYTEALFVVVIMALASTRPVITLAEHIVRSIARVGGATPAAWWVSILIVAPMLGSLITEPGAMTIGALLLAGQFFERQPPVRLQYATLGLLFVNISIGGTLTHFAAPPVLMVARLWNWDTPFMLVNFGWKAAIAIVLSTVAYYVIFRRELQALASRGPAADGAAGDTAAPPIPIWITATHIAFMIWTVVNAHYPALFLGGFILFLGFLRITDAHQTRLDLRTPLLVGVFLAGLVIHGGLQAWWIAPLLTRLNEMGMFFGATVLTAFNDNALITYLATLVPAMDEPLRIAVVEGAVTGGGLTVIANAPNPAGQALLSRFFQGAINPLGLFAGAVLPTVIAAAMFRLL